MNHGTVSREIASGLLELQARIEAAKIPSSKLDESVNIATWNIREFGRTRRTEAAIHYIAEIIGQFDLVGMVEVRDNLTDLGRVLAILGPYWRAVYSDAIRDPGGNRERFAFVYDKRAVTFNGLAAEADAPREKVDNEYIPRRSFWRSPYMGSFRAGSFDFVAMLVHARWGDSIKSRELELEMLADWVEEKRKSPYAEDRDVFLMGDFNVPSLKHATYRALTKYGLQIPRALVGRTFGSNLKRDMWYDQILHHPLYAESFTSVGGVLDFYGDKSGIKDLFPALGSDVKKFTYQMSDHLPLWIQVNTDTEGLKLEQIVNG